MELVPGRRRYALAFGYGDALNPDDFLAVRDQRQAVTDLSRNMGVHQDVLYSLGMLEAQRAHPVARIEGIYWRKDLRSQQDASESPVVVGRNAARREREPAQVGLELGAGDVEQRPRQVADAPAHGGEPARTAAAKQMEW